MVSKKNIWDKGVISLPLSRDFVWFLLAFILIGTFAYFMNILLLSSNYRVVEQPFVKKIRSIYSNDKNDLLKIYTHGGLCVSGQECSITIQISREGKIVKEDKILGFLEKADLDKLTKAIDSANYQVMFQKKFTDTCPIAYDGTETVYTFHSAKGVEVIDSCEVEINQNWELFKVLGDIMNNHLIL